MTSRPPRAPGRRNHRSEILREALFAIASFRARQPAISDLEIPARLAAYTDVDLRHLTAAGQSEADHQACVITQPGKRVEGGRHEHDDEDADEPVASAIDGESGPHSTRA